MQKQELIRTDQRILRFWGDELYSASTKRDRDDERWKVVRIFRGKDCWVVGIARMTSWMEERDLFAAFEARNKEEVVALINEAVPELTENVVKVLHLQSINQERLRKELEKWKKRNPIKDRELLSLSGKDGSQSHQPNGWCESGRKTE
jgi:hypothetical protein